MSISIVLCIASSFFIVEFCRLASSSLLVLVWQAIRPHSVYKVTVRAVNTYSFQPKSRKRTTHERERVEEAKRRKYIICIFFFLYRRRVAHCCLLFFIYFSLSLFVKIVRQAWDETVACWKRENIYDTLWHLRCVRVWACVCAYFVYSHVLCKCAFAKCLESQCRMNESVAADYQFCMKPNLNSNFQIQF